MYLEKIDCIDNWYFGQNNIYLDAYEVPEYNGTYPGNRLCFFESPSGHIFEPVKEVHNVYIDKPIYDREKKSFGFLRFDFNKNFLKVIIFNPLNYEVNKLISLPMAEIGELINVRLLTSPLTLIRDNVNYNSVDFIWPNKVHLVLEDNEGLTFHDNGKLYSSKWIEDPDYREEIIIRDAETGKIIDRIPGYLTQMPDGSIWITSK